MTDKKWLNKMFFVWRRDNKSGKITLLSHGIVSFWKALTKQAWQLLSPENSGKLRGRQRAEWRSHVVHSVALGAVKVTHDPVGTRVQRWQTASCLCHKATGVLVEYLLHITTLTSNLEPRVNWECQEKGTCSKCCLNPFMLSCTLWKMCDNKAALSRILSHVKDKCFHHFRMALGHFCCCSAIIARERREQVPTKVFTVSLSLSPFFLSHQTKSFSMLWYNCSPSLSEEEEDEEVSLSAWWKCPSAPPIISFRAPGWHQIDKTAVKTEDDSFTLSSNRAHVDPGNPTQLWICSTSCLAASDDELEVTLQTPLAHCLTGKGSGWGKKTCPQSLVLAVSHCIPDLSPRALCLLSVYVVLTSQG